MSGSSELGLLLETEDRLDGLLRRTRQEAEELVAAARAAAVEREATLAAELEAAGDAVAREIEADRHARESAIAAEAQRQAARYDGVPPARVETIARRLVDRLVEGEGEVGREAT